MMIYHPLIIRSIRSYVRHHELLDGSYLLIFISSILDSIFIPSSTLIYKIDLQESYHLYVIISCSFVIYRLFVITDRLIHVSIFDASFITYHPSNITIIRYNLLYTISHVSYLLILDILHSSFHSSIMIHTHISLWWYFTPFKISPPVISIIITHFLFSHHPCVSFITVYSLHLSLSSLSSCLNHTHSVIHGCIYLWWYL